MFLKADPTIQVVGGRLILGVALLRSGSWPSGRSAVRANRRLARVVFRRRGSASSVAAPQ